MTTQKVRAEQLVLASLIAFPEQLRAGYAAGIKAARPLPRKPKAIVYAGMGGSALAAQIFESSLLGDSIPVTIVRDYHLPAWVGSDTLVVMVTYSGTTEEVLSVFHDAKKKHAMLLALSIGGALERLAKKTRTPFILLPEYTNPSRQPRMGLVMMLGALLGAHHAMGLVSFSAGRVAKAALRMKGSVRRYAQGGPRTPHAVAARAIHREMLIIGSRRSAGIVHAFANQLNETAKLMAHWHLLPELNHHLLEGVQFPSVRTRPLGAVVVSFPGESPSIEKRRRITISLFTRMGIRVFPVKSRAKNNLDATLELLAWGSFLSFELARLHHVHPTAIPWVEHFKQQLKK